MSTNTVVAVRLVNGDEIIGRLKDGSKVSDPTFTFQKVRHLLVQRTQEGLGVTLMPWSFSNIDGDVLLFSHSVLAILSITADNITSYLQQTTSIQLSL